MWEVEMYYKMLTFRLIYSTDCKVEVLDLSCQMLKFRSTVYYNKFHLFFKVFNPQ